MTKNIQLHVPAPCHEDWAAMRPGEKGRFCASCCKTVVDFSLMSDREVLGYLAAVSGNVCGRFAEDQLQRELMPPPQRKNKGWVVWNLLLIGLLASSKSRGQGKSPGPDSQVSPGKVANSGKAVIAGKAASSGKLANPGKTSDPVLVMGSPAQVTREELIVVGDVALAPKKDSAPPAPHYQELPPAPHYQELPPVEVISYRTMGKMDILGGLTSVSDDDTLVIDIIKSPVRRFVSDTLTFLGPGKKDFSVYPNPAGRGTVIKLSLNLNQTGAGMIGLYNEAGVLLQNKAVELDAKSRIELFNLPASLPGGLYFLRVSSPGLKKVYMQKLIVL